MEPENKISTDVIQKNADSVSFFDENNNFVLAFKKTEKLASAVYMVSGLFSENEPMKWTLRKKVGDLLSLILVYKDAPEGSIGDLIYDAKTKATELVSLLEISVRGGLISQMNSSILKQEFFNLISILSASISPSTKPANESITKNFFEVSKTEIYHQNRDFNEGKNSKSSDSPGFLHRMSDSEIKDKSLNTQPDNLKKTNRQNTIINLIRKKGELTIKDISLVIKDCSEKTIQRELNAYIATGVLKRSGVRRWSKYSLV